MVPQLHSIWKRKSARDVSLTMILIFGLGVALWLTYGIVIRSIPVIAANAATLVLVIAILTFKLRYDRKSGQ
jgi:MtN3 and saliva related transmembrane protein